MKTSYPIANISQYNPLTPIQGPYKTTFLGDYNLGGEGTGSHPGVDIAVPVGTPILAVADGTVEKVKVSSSWGNLLILKHFSPNGAVFFSCYAHLSEISVVEKATVACGDAVGKTGNTGSSTGPHLHFQIDKFSAPTHPFWPFTSKEASNTMAGVNQGIGAEKVKLYCENPLVYLEQLKEPPTFSDVPASHPNVTAISSLAADGILGGFPDGTFRPDAPVTRAEFLKIVFKTLKIPAASHPIPFTDVKKTDWAFFYIAEAYFKKWISGYADKTFRPNDSITRAESVKLLCSALGKSLPAVETPPFTDVSVAEWYAPYAAFAQEQTFFSFANDQFEQNKAITRGEAAEMVWKMWK